MTTNVSAPPASSAYRRHRSGIHEGSRVADAIMILVTAIICCITLYPMFYVLIMSLSSAQHVLAMDVYFYPKGFQLSSYQLICADSAMWKAYGNTLIYTASTTVLQIITCCLGAYPLTIPYLKGRKILTLFILIPMYFGGGMIPTYILISKLGLYNTMWAIIIPSAVSIWNMILVRTYFAGLPDALRESAFIDGANHFQVLFRIYLPLSKPILAVIAIYAIVGMWNSWFSAQLYLPNSNLHPLQMYLQRVLQQSVDLKDLTFQEYEDAVEKMFSAMQLKYSMIIFTTLPIIFSYPFFQKYFIKGIMVGSLKG